MSNKLDLSWHSRVESYGWCGIHLVWEGSLRVHMGHDTIARVGMRYGWRCQCNPIGPTMRLTVGLEFDVLSNVFSVLNGI